MRLDYSPSIRRLNSTIAAASISNETAHEHNFSRNSVAEAVSYILCTNSTCDAPHQLYTVARQRERRDRDTLSLTCSV